MADNSEQSQATAPAAGRQLVVFAVQGEEYALPIEAVHEIVAYEPPRSVASGDKSLRGVMNLRGSIVPVYDLRPVLGLGEPAAAGGKVVIAQLGDAIAGVIVDDVAEVLTVAIERFEDLPAATHEAVEGVVRHGERLIVILDPDAIVAPEPTAEAAGVDDRAGAAASPPTPDAQASPGDPGEAIPPRGIVNPYLDAEEGGDRK